MFPAIRELNVYVNFVIIYIYIRSSCLGRWILDIECMYLLSIV